MARNEEYAQLAREHASAAAHLLHDVDTRRHDGPGHGAVKAQSANAHALLALFYQGEAEATS